MQMGMRGGVQVWLFLCGHVREIFELLASENVNGDQMHLGVSVLAGLRRGHVDDLAGAALDAHVAVLAQSRALERHKEVRKKEKESVFFSSPA